MFAFIPYNPLHTKALLLYLNILSKMWKLNFKLFGRFNTKSLNSVYLSLLS